MTNKLIVFSLGVFMAAGILSACNSSGTKQEATQGYKDSSSVSTTTVTDTIGAAKRDWEDFKADADKNIMQNEDSLHAFKMRIEHRDAKIKAKYDREIARLQQKNDVMKARLADYKDEGKEKWEKFKVDFTSSMDTLSVNIKDFFKGDKRR